MSIPTPSELAKNATTAVETAEAKLKDILSKVDARYLFTTYARCRMCDANQDGTFHYLGPHSIAVELAAWCLFPFFGTAGDRDSGLIQEGIDAMEALMKAHEVANMFAREDSGTDAQKGDSLQSHARIHSRLVRGSAYPIQIRNRIAGLFAPFETEGFSRGARKAQSRTATHLVAGAYEWCPR